MKTPYKIAVFLLLFPTLLFANHIKEDGKYTQEKTIHKEFMVNPNAKLKITNSYGNIDIITWNENRIVIDIVITIDGKNKDVVQKKLNDISVSFSGNSELVTAKTVINSNRSSWGWFSGNNNNNSSMEINYTVKMPVTNSVVLSNDYGAISIDKLEGHAKINCDYGQLIIGDLLAEDNYLNFDYTTKSTINYMKSGKINADYSSFTLDKVEELELNADYTNSEITEANIVNYSCDYGKIKIGKAYKIKGIGDYISHRIGTVTNEINIRADYGAIKVSNLTATVKSAVFKADYTTIKIGFDKDFNFDFIINLEYANLSGKDNITINHSSVDNGDKRYSGFHGSENSGNTLNINTDYGSVTLHKN